MARRLLGGIDAIVEPAIAAARIPGAAVAVVVGDEIVCTRGYGYRDARAKLPMTPATCYPIASTTKAMSATLLGMLVDESRLAWDAPVQTYLPRFRLGDPSMSGEVTLRDLLCMRTGLPRHDWLWLGNPMTRAELLGRLRHLELSAGFRERFQYSNITATIAGHVAEEVTGRSWEDLVRERLFEPLQMRTTRCGPPGELQSTVCYHETREREIVASQPFASAVTAPSGGAIYSTVDDMAQWILFNLKGGDCGGQQLIAAATLAEIQAPQIVARGDTSCPSPHAAYCFGWFLDTHDGRVRLTHGGYLNDLVSEVSLFPQDSVGLVTFINFGPPGIARYINTRLFDLMMALDSFATPGERLRQYETSVLNRRSRIESAPRVHDTVPSHGRADYVGIYEHPGYGQLEIRRNGESLALYRGTFSLELRHWHYDAWVSNDARFTIHVENPFDATNLVLFETNGTGDINALTLRLEPAVSRVRFAKRRSEFVATRSGA